MSARNDDGVIDEKDLFEGETIDYLKCEPYWIEISGVRVPRNNGRGWSDTNGFYWDYESAFKSAWAAIIFFEKGMPKGWLDPEFGTDNNPYGTKHYNASSNLLKALKTINDLIDEIQEPNDL